MNIDPEKFTELGISAIKEMAEVAKRNGQQEVEVWHLLSALMAQERSTDIIILPMENAEGFRILSPPERERGLNDDDLEALLPLSREIISLDLTHAEISDRGLVTLSNLINLQRLYLEGNKGISVEGIAQLKSLKNLSYLNLVRIELNKDLVDQLISMENLREIYLFETGLDESSIARLKEARPKVFVNGG